MRGVPEPKDELHYTGTGHVACAAISVRESASANQHDVLNES
jgi:hypothetical protein